ncbi:MAG: hypothetical protein HY431_01040 [Candidatus Levybacteria bacterium]|nr:hypothetical protein [Candidatus Levybacteria bacterium]
MNRSSAQAEEPMRQEGAGSSFPASDAFFAALLEALQDPNAARKDPDLDARMGQLYDEMDRETNAILERNRQRVRAYRMSEEQSSIEESPEITRLSEFRDGSTRQNMSIGMRGEILQAVNAVNIVVWSAVTSLNIAAGNERAALITTGITGASGIYAVLTIGRNR